MRLKLREKSIVLRVRADPEPNLHVSIADRNGPVMDAYSRGEYSRVEMNLAEAQARMLGV